MTQHSQYIVQFVGFSTKLSEHDFINRWAPFAVGFKNAGMKSIDLYKISNNNTLAFISRNIWDAQTYFQNFPTGVAGSGSGGGISVTQFGGYWISENELAQPHQMQLLFSDSDVTSSKAARERCTENVMFEKQFELSENDRTFSDAMPAHFFICTHIKTM